VNREVLIWATALADVTAKATLVLAVAWLGARATRRAPAAARHLIWMISLGTLLLLPVLEAVAPRRTLFSIPSETAVSAEQPSFVSNSPPAGDAPTGIDGALPVDFAAAQPVPASSNPVNLVIWVGGAWAGGCAVVLLSALIGLVALNRIKARVFPLPAAVSAAGRGRRVRLRVSREGRPPSALTWGALHPTILLPRAAEEWPQERLETVLLHELEHVRRWDAAMQLMGIAVCALYWFHPAVWLAAKAARTEAEAATDDAVLRRGVRPSAYANTLMEVAAEIGRRPFLVSPTGVAFMKRSKIEARLRAILDGRTRRGITRTEKAVAVTIAVAILVPLAFVRAAAVAPFAALPDNSDPFVSIHVTPRATHQKLTKKQLAAQRAHHLRALAMQDRAAAQRTMAADLALQRARDLAGFTPEQAKQALEAGQLLQSLRDGSGGTSKDTVIMDAGGGVQSQLTNARLQELDRELSKRVRFQIKSGVHTVSFPEDPAALAKAFAKGSLDGQPLNVKGFISQADAKKLDATLANKLISQVDAKGVASALAMVKDLTFQMNAKGLDPAFAASLISQVDTKGVASALAMVKDLKFQINAKGLDPAFAASLSSQVDAKGVASTLLMTQNLTAQKAAEKGSQDALRRKLEADRAILEAQKSAMRTLEEEIRTVQAQQAALAAQTGQANAEKLKMLEAHRALLQSAKLQLQNVRGQAADVRRQTASSLFTKDRAKLAQESYTATVRAQRDALNKHVENLYGAHGLKGHSGVYSAKQRKAMLKRERAALVTRLKAIEAELGKKAK